MRSRIRLRGRGTVHMRIFIEPTEVGAPELLEPLQGVDEIWPCEQCGKDNFATGMRRCSHCHAAAPRSLADDPSYCCERCEHLTSLIREAGGVKDMADHLIAGFEKQLEAIHR